MKQLRLWKPKMQKKLPPDDVVEARKKQERFLAMLLWRIKRSPRYR